jgi:outer membrane protein TolC
MKIEKYKRLQADAEQARRDNDRAMGRRDQLLRELKTKFGLKTLKQARRKLKDLQQQADKADANFDAALDEFEAKWFDKLYPGQK